MASYPRGLPAAARRGRRAPRPVEGRPLLDTHAQPDVGEWQPDVIEDILHRQQGARRGVFLHHAVVCLDGNAPWRLGGRHGGVHARCPLREDLLGVPLGRPHDRYDLVNPAVRALRMQEV